jgi:hypothetical protein
MLRGSVISPWVECPSIILGAVAYIADCNIFLTVETWVGGYIMRRRSFSPFRYHVSVSSIYIPYIYLRLLFLLISILISLPTHIPCAASPSFLFASCCLSLHSLASSFNLPFYLSSYFFFLSLSFFLQSLPFTTSPLAPFSILVSLLFSLHRSHSLLLSPNVVSLGRRAAWEVVLSGG